MIDLLLQHSSVRQYTDQPVPQDVRDTILRCAQMAPSSSFFQAYSIIEVRDPDKRETLSRFAGGQKWVVSAPLVFLFCADLNRNQQLLDIEDPHVLHNTESFTVAVTDTALAAQKALIAAQSLGLGGVTVGGIRNETEGVAELFGLPDLVFPLFLLCLGYPRKTPPPKPRFPLDIVVGVDRYPAVEDRQAFEQFNQTILDYTYEQTDGAESFNWVQRCSHALAMKPRYTVGEFLRKKGFLLK